MKCIVTAGPAYEELDEVRRLTNFSTGALGIELANFLAARGHDVHLLVGHYSTCRIEPKVQRTRIFTTSADLRRRLRAMRRIKPDAVFHAAAISDFTFGKVWNRDTNGKLMEVRSPKITSCGGRLIVELLPAPKIISELRGWFPKAWLVGWKYELEGNRTEAIARAARQLAENQTNACVVNGRAYGDGFGLLTINGKCAHLPDKPKLMQALERKLETAPIRY